MVWQASGRRHGLRFSKECVAGFGSGAGFWVLDAGFWVLDANEEVSTFRVLGISAWTWLGGGEGGGGERALHHALAVEVGSRQPSLCVNGSGHEHSCM